MDAHPFVFLITFLSVQALASISPGPAFAIVSQKALSGGRRSGFAAAVGCALGCGIWLIATMIGITFLLERFYWLYLILRIVGAGYLMYLAVMLWRHAGEPLATPGTLEPGGRSLLEDFRTALFVQLSNPKALAYCASVLITILPHEQPLWMKFAVPALGTAVEAAWWFTLAAMMSNAGFRRGYSFAKAHIERLIGAGLGLLGVKLLLEKP